MTVSTPPYVLEAGSHDSRVPRQMAAAMFGVDLLTAFNTSLTAFNKGCGVVHSADFTVKQNGSPNMSVLVEGGICVVRGKFANYNQGVYSVASDTTDVSLAISAADGTNPRKDLIIVQVRDATWGGDAANDCRLLVVTGTPAASPADPSLAAFNAYFVLARVNVGAGVTSITNANIDDLRYMCGPVYKGTSARRASLVVPADYEGLTWWDTDTNFESTWDGTAWQRTNGPTGGQWRRVANQSIPNVTTTSISWDTEDNDTDGFLTPTSSVLTVPANKGGIYSVSLTVTGASAVPGVVLFNHAGATIWQAPLVAITVPSLVSSVAGTLSIAAAQTITCQIYQSSGGAINFTARLDCWKVSNL